MDRTIEQELKDLRRWNKFARRFGLPTMTEEQLLERATNWEAYWRALCLQAA